MKRRQFLAVAAALPAASIARPMVRMTRRGTLLLNQQIANSRYGTGAQTDTDAALHPHLIDFYIPRGPVARAAVVLPGGLATKESIALQLGLIGGASPTTVNTNWGVMGDWVVACPAGQHMDGTVNSLNPTGINTESIPLPNGISCWRQYDMNSGADDKQFLIDLAAHLVATYGVPAPMLCGHSAGGFMAQVMWYEAPTAYGHYAASGGCVPIALSGAAMPGTVRPLMMQFGDDDTILAVRDGSAGAGSHFYEDTFTQVASNVNKAGYNWPSQSIRVGGWKSYVDRVQAIYSVTPVQGDGVVTTMAGNGRSMTTWQHGVIKLRKLDGCPHGVIEQAAATSLNLFGEWRAFALAN